MSELLMCAYFSDTLRLLGICRVRRQWAYDVACIHGGWRL